MLSISNIKIGRKISFALGGVVLVLVGMAALSLWGASTNERLAVTLAQRLTKARLAEMVTGESAGVAGSASGLVAAGVGSLFA